MNKFLIIIIFILIFIIGYSYTEHLSNDIIYETSTLDNNTYLVRNARRKDIAADVLAILTLKLKILCNAMKLEYPDDVDVKRLCKNYNKENISESSINNKYTSYSVNKGQQIIFCIRQKDEKQTIIDINLATFIAIHELAHLMTESIGHLSDFWTNFNRLLLKAIELGIYKNEDYSKYPKKYCGIMVTDNPLFKK